MFTIDASHSSASLSLWMGNQRNGTDYYFSNVALIPLSLGWHGTWWVHSEGMIIPLGVYSIMLRSSIPLMIYLPYGELLCGLTFAVRLSGLEGGRAPRTKILWSGV